MREKNDTHLDCLAGQDCFICLFVSSFLLFMIGSFYDFDFCSLKLSNRCSTSILHDYIYKICMLVLHTLNVKSKILEMARHLAITNASFHHVPEGNSEAHTSLFLCSKLRSTTLDCFFVLYGLPVILLGSLSLSPPPSPGFKK